MPAASDLEGSLAQWLLNDKYRRSPSSKCSEHPKSKTVKSSLPSGQASLQLELGRDQCQLALNLLMKPDTCQHAQFVAGIPPISISLGIARSVSRKVILGPRLMSRGEPLRRVSTTASRGPHELAHGAWKLPTRDPDLGQPFFWKSRRRPWFMS